MTGLIYEEYLQWLNNRMRSEGRKVLLLIDNFSGHKLAMQLVGGKTSLSNIRIEWLLPNTTAIWQPMDQGIIASFKLQYCRQWVAFMVREYKADKNPQKIVNLLKAVQWTRVAWEQSVTQITIKRCWWKSTLIKKPEEPIGELIAEDDQSTERAELQAQITQLPIKNPLSLNEFLTLNNKVIIDKDEDIFVSVVDYYSIDKLGEESESSDKEEIEEIDTAEALRYIETLKLCKLQKGNSQDL
jgi:hypothetical protein